MNSSIVKKIIMPFLFIVFILPCFSKEMEYGLLISNTDKKGKNKICTRDIRFENKTNSNAKFLVILSREDNPLDIVEFSSFINNTDKNYTLVYWGAWGEPYLCPIEYVDWKSWVCTDRTLLYNTDKIYIISLEGKITDYKIYCRNDDLHIDIWGVDSTINQFDDAVKNDIIRKKDAAAQGRLMKIQCDNKNYKDGDFWWTFDSEGTGCKILAYVGEDEVVSIPSSIRKLPVTTIKSWLSKKALEITIPASVTTIEEPSDYYYPYNTKRSYEVDALGVFENCNIRKIKFQNNSKLNFVGSNAFAYNNLQTFDLPSKKITISKTSFYGNPIKTLFINQYWDFIEPAWRIKIEKGFEIHEYMAEYFSKKGIGLYELETVNFEDGCTSIIKQFFYKIKTLKKVILPSSINRIDEEAFFECTALKSIVLSANGNLGYEKKNNFYSISSRQFVGCPLDFQSVKALRALGFGDGAF